MIEDEVGRSRHVDGGGREGAPRRVRGSQRGVGRVAEPPGERTSVGRSVRRGRVQERPFRIVVWRAADRPVPVARLHVVPECEGIRRHMYDSLIVGGDRVSRNRGGRVDQVAPEGGRGEADVHEGRLSKGECDRSVLLENEVCGRHLIPVDTDEEAGVYGGRALVSHEEARRHGRGERDPPTGTELLLPGVPWHRGDETG